MTAPLIDRVLRAREVCKILGISRATLWRREREGLFPKSVRLTQSTVGWFERDIARHQAELRAQAGLPEDTATAK
ncbi:helix-turn-helix transcriptional regulator [Bradyrhizobium sp. McL0616]|uniref:helix-turn-helix transcriptional regulator n=1 Tax=Bradyrhizobium sp. McL0616 TaxID=3415674 RepID=UPI003CF23BEB